jgi:RNA polymerase sigma-70 factor, ECF subfamily
VVSALFRSASTTAFDKLYRRHAASVYRYARAVLGNHADAEDVTQQTFLNAYRALAQGTKPRKAENWLFTIAHNEVRRHLRDSRPRRLEVELGEELAHPEPERGEPSVTDVLRGLQVLTPNQRSALVMREFEGRPYAEIAEIMGISQTALETLIFRARRTLAEALEDGLTCAEAELAVSRRLDGRLSRRDARRLKAHMRECRLCMGFEQRQKRQRTLLKGLSVIPVPASLFVFRGEQAAAAAGGLGVGAAAAGGSAGVAAKAAAVVAAVTVAGGVGYTAGSEPAAPRAAKATAAREATQAPAPSKVAAAPVQRASRADRVAPAPAIAARAKPRRKGVQVQTAKPKKAQARAVSAEPGRGAAKVTHDARRAQKPAHPLKAKPARTNTPARANTPRRQASPPKSSARAHTKPTPTKPARPEKAARERPLTPAPAVPPGQERQQLELQPEKPEKAKPS